MNDKTVRENIEEMKHEMTKTGLAFRRLKRNLSLLARHYFNKLTGKNKNDK